MWPGRLVSELASPYFLYTVIGTTGFWLASRVARRRVLTSRRLRSILTLSPLLFPLAIMVLIGPDLSTGMLLKFGPIPPHLWRAAGIPLLLFLQFEMWMLATLANALGILCIIGLVIASIFAVTTKLFGERIVYSIYSIVTPEKGEFPQLEGCVEKLARKAGIRTPKILISEDLRPNAFTMGHGKGAKMVFSLGILRSTTAKQLEAVVAHEIMHLKNNDYFVKLLTSSLRFVSFFNPLAHIAASETAKERELLADEGAVELIGGADALVAGLKLASIREPRTGRYGVAALLSSLFLTSPMIHGFSVLSSHPTLDQRIEATSGSKERNPGRIKRLAWGILALAIVVASVYLPAKTGEALTARATVLGPNSARRFIAENPRSFPTESPPPFLKAGYNNSEGIGPIPKHIPKETLRSVLHTDSGAYPLGNRRIQMVATLSIRSMGSSKLSTKHLLSTMTNSSFYDVCEEVHEGPQDPPEDFRSHAFPLRGIRPPSLASYLMRLACACRHLF